MEENKNYLTDQIITYLGNKRSLLGFIEPVINIVLTELNKEKIDCFDVFSGSGIVSRFLKKYSNNIYVNDLEDYCETINKCYLINKEDIDTKELDYYLNFLKSNLKDDMLKDDGFIRKLYAPKDENNIDVNDRVFYTIRNARYIDTCRQLLNDIKEPYKTLFLGELLYEASTKNNTSGVFKGFYKNSITHCGQFGGNGEYALARIKDNIDIKIPILSNFNCNVHVLKGDSNIVCKMVPFVDLAYLDPPYNQHPYSSNYFMLNLINNYIEPKDISKVSGIPTKRNKSTYNNKQDSLKSFEELCKNIKSHYLLISFNSEGFISKEEMINMLSKLGNVRIFEKKYNTFRGCRNLNKRNKYVKEYLFLLKKEG